MKKWTAEFKRRESVEDDGRTGCPKDAIADEIVKDVHTPVISDRRRGLQSIASNVGISFREGKINPNDILGMSKIPARWVPQMLTDVWKRTWLDISRCLLSCYEDDPCNFMEQFVTQDETCTTEAPWLTLS